MAKGRRVQIALPEKFLPLVTLARRYKVLYGGRGGGKSYQIVLALLVLAMRSRLRVLCCREIQESIKQSVHQLFRDMIEKHGLGDFFTVTDTEIRGANGSLFIFKGLSTETQDSLKSLAGINIAWVEEAQSISEASLRILLPTIREDGSEVWFSFNPRLENDPIYFRFVKNTEPNAWVQYVSISDNPFASQTLWDECIRDYELDPVMAGHVWGGKCLPAIEGAIYASEFGRLKSEGRLIPIAYDSFATTDIAFDLGIGDHTSVVIGQKAGFERRILHAYENSGFPISHYIDHVKSLGLRIDRIALPHDSNSKSLQTGVSTRSLVAQAFPSAEIIVVGIDDGGQKLGLEEQISAVRERFPTLWIDSRHCETLTNAIERYRRRFDKVNKIFREPLHDTYSDMADALRYFMLLEPPRKRNQSSARKTHIPPPMTLYR